MLLREKPRDLTGPYENPVRRWVRLREKARLFAELPPLKPPPLAKPNRRKPLQALGGVPRVSPEVLQKRLDFLLSPDAVLQQLAAPLRPGLSPYFVEFTCWSRQLRECRRIYRAQYLLKLAEVTEIERGKEAELHKRAMEERRNRKQAHLQKIGEDMKRRAILKDRKRIEAKVTEAIEMARRSKVKRHRLYWFRRMENLSKLIVSAGNFEEVFPPIAASASANIKASEASPGAGIVAPAASGVFLSRNVSVPFLLRQLGGAKGYPTRKSHRLPHVHNVQRELMELSYDIMPEDAHRFEPMSLRGPGPAERAMQLYGKWSDEEKRQLLDQKIELVERELQQQLEKGDSKDGNVTAKLLEELRTVQAAVFEGEAARQQKAVARKSRGADPAGLPPPFPKT